ncbi:MAG: DMT family transporter [Oscillospiraceae bacterium]|nr:DMT family transporter [Oscillospiraceae bacterium]
MGIVYILLAALCFSGMTLFVRLSGNLTTAQKCVFRNLPAVFIAGLSMKRQGIGLKVDKVNRFSMAMRCVCGTLGMVCNFYAIDHLVLTDSNMLNKLSPFFAILLSYFILKESLTAAQVLGVAAAFCGALMIIKPSFTNVAFFPALLGALGGLGAGTAYTFVRKMGQNNESGKRIVFYFSAFTCLCTIPWAIATWKPMSLSQFLILMCAGLCGAGGQFSITKAYYYAPARELSVYDYSQVIFAAMWGFIFFDQIPDLLSVCGYIVIIGAAVVMFMYNNAKGPFRHRDMA